MNLVVNIDYTIGVPPEFMPKKEISFERPLGAKYYTS
jgi:hypothetical protein